ncbi:MAG: phage tail protein [Bacilli bacterium]|nr:phage tail protein [Bacilli bacterium]
MIPILYKADATNFNTYGIGALSETTSCIVTEERNGKYELTLKYPTNGSLYRELKKERIIKAKPNDTSSNQAFRIYRITIPINGVVSVYAQHISYDLAGIAVTPFSLTGATPTQAMEAVLGNATIPHQFTFRTDYSSAKDFMVDKPKSIRACLGGSAGSLMSEWGGEFEWDNFKIIHHQGRGNNNGVVIEYGKNLTKFDHDSDVSDVYTDLLPYAVKQDEEGNDVVITLPEQLIPISTTLEKRKNVIKDFTDSFDDDEPIDEEHLRAKAEKYLKNNPLGIETPTINISFEALWKQPEFVAVLERVSLCDTVTVRHSELGVTIKTKVVKTSYDTLLEKYTSITLGSSKANLADDVRTISNEVETTKKSVDRFPSLVNSAVSTATKLITGNSGGNVVLHSSPTGEPYELLIMDSEDIGSAVNVWRWNLGGLGLAKLRCAECGHFFGIKVWHSNSIHRKEVLQCNGKYKCGCKSPNLSQDEVNRKFIEVYNQVMDNKEGLIEDTKAVVEMLTSTEEIDAKVQALANEMEEVQLLVENLIHDNARRNQDQEEYERHYKELVNQFNSSKAKMESLLEEKQSKLDRIEILNAFIASLEDKEAVIDEFSTDLWNLMIQDALVDENGTIKFVFKNGIEITK